MSNWAVVVGSPNSSRMVDEIRWAVFSTAEQSLPKHLPSDALKKEFENVLDFYGLDRKNASIFTYEVRRLGSYRQEILDDMIRIRLDFVPDVVIGPSMNDFHQDHQIIANEMVRAFKTSSGIICYELPWNDVTFDSQLFIDLKRRHMEKKYQALQHYRSQVEMGREYFKEEFIFGLAKMRGIQCNSEYAEAFEVVRWKI